MMAHPNTPLAGTEKSCPKPRLMRLKPDFLDYSGIKSVKTVYKLAALKELRLVKQDRGTFVDLQSHEDMIARNGFMPDRADFAHLIDDGEAAKVAVHAGK